MKFLFISTFILLISVTCNAQINKEVFEFEFEGVTLNGVLNTPQEREPKGIILIVHGSGKTNAVEDEWYYDVREQFVKSGYAVYMWDKIGCGKSGGTFDYNQSVQNSADEVIAAINKIKKMNKPGSDKIGLWGISRAGWINPLVINKYRDIEFWISVSGVDGKENFKYLLKQNLRIEGLSEDSVKFLVSEWQKGVHITHTGGSFEEYVSATKNLEGNSFYKRFINNRKLTKKGYYAYQKEFMKSELDPETGLPIYIQNFDQLLSRINVPVLALFGERDMNVDWRKTLTLYKKTLGENTDLTIKTFPNCNHNLFKSNTGGFYEFEDNEMSWIRCDGFLESMNDWLSEIE
jgi:hypothetical protein